MDMSDSGMIDLFEEMLYERAAKGIRPVLYVSSQKDLECSVLMLLGETPEVQLSGRQRTATRGFRATRYDKLVSGADPRIVVVGSYQRASATDRFQSIVLQ